MSIQVCFSDQNRASGWFYVSFYFFFVFFFFFFCFSFFFFFLFSFLFFFVFFSFFFFFFFLFFFFCFFIVFFLFVQSYSPDRPTKVAACELLHAITIVLVGTHSEMSAEKREKSTLMELIAKLMPKILELSCDVEPVARQIFEPLAFQMVRWFSRAAHKASGEASAVLDCVLEGLVSERNPALRNLCACCLKEFLVAATNQHGNQTTVPPAAASLLERMISYAGHSSSAKRSEFFNSKFKKNFLLISWQFIYGSS